MSDLLTASHLSAEEEAVLAFGDFDHSDDEFTLVNAVERLRRIAYHKARVEGIAAQAQLLIAPLHQEAGRITDWMEKEFEAPLASITHHESWLRRYYERNPPAKGKSVKLPNGVLQQTQPAPTWSYPDDEEKFALSLSIVRPDLTIYKVRLVKDEFKRVAKDIDGVAHVQTEDGEWVPTGVTVTTPPPKFTVTLPKAKAPADD